MRILLLAALAVALAAAETVPTERIAALSFDDCRADNAYVAPVRDPALLDGERAARFAAWLAKLDAWAPASDPDPLARTCALLDCAAMHDLARNEFEGEIARTAFDRLRASVSGAELVQCCARLVEGIDGSAVTTRAPELLGFPGAFAEDAVRLRARVYAKKLLGRLLGKLPE